MRLHPFLLSGLIFLGSASHGADEFIYTVQPGDHPWNISQRYLRDTSDASRLTRLNRIANDRAVAPGTKLRIPAQWLRLEAAVVRLLASSGETYITPEGASPRAAVAGETVRPGALLRTGAQSSATLVFEDGSRVMLRQGSELRILRSDKRAVDGGFLVTLELVRGGLENMVTPRPRNDNRFEIRTPAAVAAVRGTRFRVNSELATTWTEVLEGAVDVGNNAGAVLAQAGFGTVAKTGRPPDPPRPLLPAPDLSVLPARLERLPIDWPVTPVPGAVAYRTQLAPDAAFDAVVSDELTAAPRARVLDIADRNYVMRVTAIDADGLEGLPAERSVLVYARPFAPSLISPPPGGETALSRPVFSWTQVDPAWHYKLELRRTDDSATPPVHVQISRNAGPMELDTNLTPGVYHWRVASIVPATGRQGPWGDMQSFRVVLPSPAVEPPQIEPGQITMRWPALPNAQAYDFQLARADDSAKPLLDLRVTAAQHQLKDLEPGSYRMRLRSVSQDGYAGPWGQAQVFVVPEPPKPNHWKALLLVVPALLLLGL